MGDEAGLELFEFVDGVNPPSTTAGGLHTDF